MRLSAPNLAFWIGQKVLTAQRLWNTCCPEKVVQAYTADSVWRNRDVFLQGHREILGFLRTKWELERGYKLKKSLFAHDTDRIAVQFWYEFWTPSSSNVGSHASRDEGSAGSKKESLLLPEEEEQASKQWWRCYGLEHWTFASDGKMQKRHMSGNNVAISHDQRWFSSDMTDEEIDSLVLDARHH